MSLYEILFGGKPENIHDDLPKQEKVQTRRLYFPAETIIGLYQREDAVYADGGSVAKFELWRYVSDVFPEAKSGMWVIKKGYNNRILQPYIEEVL